MIKLTNIFNQKSVIFSALALVLFTSSCDDKRTESAQESASPRVATVKSSLTGIAAKAPKEQAPKVDPRTQTPVEIVTDSTVLEVENGGEKPILGDEIYTYYNLPVDACGTYWVRDRSGNISRVAVCNDEH